MLVRSTVLSVSGEYVNAIVVLVRFTNMTFMFENIRHLNVTILIITR